MKKRLTFALSALFVAAFIVWAMLYQAGAVGGGPKVPPGERAPAPEVVPPGGDWAVLAPTNLPVLHTAVGSVRSREEVEVFSRLPSARVVRVNVRGGDSFREGDVLVALEDEDLRAGVGAARENLRAAESRLKFAEEEYARHDRLLQSGATTRQAYDQAFRDVGDARAQAAMLRHVLENAETALGHATLCAPFDGVVCERACDPGDLATPQTLLLRVFNPAKLQLRVPVREGLAGFVSTGAVLRVSVESAGRDYLAEVREVVPSVDPGSRTFVVGACLSGDVAGLMPGMFATCEIPAGGRTVLAVPAGAVRRTGQLEFLLVADAEGGVARRLVRTAPVAGGGLRQILSGAEAGLRYLR